MRVPVSYHRTLPPGELLIPKHQYCIHECDNTTNLKDCAFHSKLFRRTTVRASLLLPSVEPHLIVVSLIDIRALRPHQLLIVFLRMIHGFKLYLSAGAHVHII